MRFIGFLIIVIFIGGKAFAAPPLPHKKPIIQNFQDILNSTVRPLTVKPDTERVPSPPPAKDIELANYADSGVMLPPPTPDIKKPFQSIETTIVNGIPLPTTKPFTVKFDDVWQPSMPKQTINSANDRETIIKYSGESYDDRTAGRITPRSESRNQGSGIERSQARPREKLRETSDRSPFATAQLPRAAKYSMDDPVIIFFKEYSSELEIGQTDVLRSDVLNPLKRSKRIRVAVYGYAENTKNTDKTNQLSLSRAMMISEFLVDNGIDASRVEARAMGDETPISPKNRVDIILF